MSINQQNKWVTLSQCPQNATASEYFPPLNPPNVWAWIQPIFGATDRRTTEHVVEMRFHPEVSVDTRIVYVDPSRPADKQTRELFVRGVQGVDEANDLMRLLCEEIAP